jgi:hypothetical protein
MVKGHSLEGLIKWLHREEWRDRFAETFDAHLLPACEQTGLEANEVVAKLGEDWFTRTVWGSAFEDFLTRDFDGGTNIVDDYLKRRGWKESASTRTYMGALRSSVPSLYEVSDIVRDKSFKARDLVQGGDPLLIIERSATRSLNQWDRIVTRVVQIGSQTHISGAILQFDYETSEQILQLLRDITKRSHKSKRNLSGVFDSNANDPAIIGAMFQRAALRVAAPMITAGWLINIIDNELSSSAIELQNIEGEEIMFCTLHYPLLAKANPGDIRSALNRCPEFRQESPTFWNWRSLQKSAKAAPKSINSKSAYTFLTKLDDGSLVLGGLELRERSLILSVNSRGRTDRGRALLSPLLRGLVGSPLVEIQALDQVMNSHKNPSPPLELNLTEDERRAVVHESLNRHYREMLDQPAPILGNKSPRAAAKTAKGRQKVADWLKLIENHSVKSVGPNNAMATHDFGWLWDELGVSDLRR